MMFRALAIVSLYVFGVWWCYEVISRFPKDIREIREVKEVVRTLAIIFVWALTVIIAILLIRYSLAVIEEIRAVF